VERALSTTDSADKLVTCLLRMSAQSLANLNNISYALFSFQATTMISAVLQMMPISFAATFF